MHTAVLEILYPVNGAASKDDKVLPPPILKKLSHVSKYLLMLKSVNKHN
jgi:hypothetical protein